MSRIITVDFLLRLRDVTVTYNGGKRRPDITPLNSFSMDVAPGELIVIFGDSGVGKSTLLHFVAGFLRPSQGAGLRWLPVRSGVPRVTGRIEIRGEEVSFLEPSEREVGLVMQRFNLYPHMTIARNLEFPLRLRKEPRSKRRLRVQEVAGRLGISSELAKYPHELSGGQQQRVAIGKTLLRNPSVILMDEPFSHLDWKWRQSLRRMIFDNVLEQKDRCILMVSHDFEDAKYADRIVMMEKIEGTSASIKIFEGNSSGGAWDAFRREFSLEEPFAGEASRHG